MLIQGFSSKKMLKAWLKKQEKPEDVCIVLYSIYEPIAKNIIRLRKKYHFKTVAFVPDLPEHMYATKRGLQGIAAQFYYRAVKKIQSEFDGYIYLTEEMKNRISSEKPYIVVEGLADESLFAAPTKASGSESEKTPIVMDAGALNKRYGIAELVEAFRHTHLDAQLHIYGFGDFVPELEKIVQEDARVCYKGRVSKEEILEREREAALLVNVRNPKDEFTAYSFPSKTIEYMSSDTPLLTSRLPGIPQEYFDYCYSISGNDVAEIQSALGGFICFGREFFALWLGDGFEDCYCLSLILIVPITFPLIVNVCLAILKAKNLLVFRTVALAYSALLNALLTFIGTKIWGYWAAAAGTAVATVIGSIISLNIYYQIKLKINVFKLYLKILRGTTLCIGVAFGAGLLLNDLIAPTGWFYFAVKAAAFIVVYGAGMLLFGLNKDEKASLMRKKQL